MYMTNYFKNINLSSLSSSLSSLESAISSIKGENTDTADLFNRTEWEGDSRHTLFNAFDNLGSKLDILKTKVKEFESLVKDAQAIDNYQKEMSDSTDVNSLNANASNITTKLDSMRNTISNMSTLGMSVMTSSISTRSLNSDGFGSGLFSINPNKFSIARDSFDDLSRMLKTNYDSFLSLKSTVSSDSYLYYGWGVVCAVFDDIMKKRDSLENWIENFIASIDDIEKGLPETVKNVTKNSTNAYAKSHEYPSKPDFKAYEKNGRVSEIQRHTSSSSSSGGSGSYGGGGSYYGGSGGYYGGGSGGSTSGGGSTSPKTTNSSGPRPPKTTNSSGPRPPKTTNPRPPKTTNSSGPKGR